MSSSTMVGAAGACALAAAVCGGVVMTAQSSPQHSPSYASANARPLDHVGAVRLAKQASFGPSVELVNHMVELGLDGWLDEQFAAKESSYADIASIVALRGHCDGLTGAAEDACERDYFSATPVAMRFYADAVNNDDQLRQRVAWALSQILVVSEVEAHSTAALAALNQIFLDKAFGNYRDVLKAVTLNADMGAYLNLADSSKKAPNENYARELMQLFTIGLEMLNPDGTVQKDASGEPLPSFTAADVREVARALTGWTYARLGNAPITDDLKIDVLKPMIPVPSRYDTGAKTFLGQTVPAGASQEASVDAVLDALFNHPNAAPFLSRALIQHLVVSNPSPAYVGRVSRVFVDNGAGVRGDLKAVIRAILTDPEARSGSGPAVAGKVKEPVLLAVALARAIGMTTDGYAFVSRAAALGQQPFRAPSVFNFYPPDFPLPQGGDLVSPPSKLLTTATIMARHNFVYDWTIAGDPGSRAEFKPVIGLAGSTGTQPRWSDWQTSDVEAQIDRVNLLLLENGLTPRQRQAMRAAMMGASGPDLETVGRRRAQVALYIAAASPQFQTDR